MHKYLLLKKLPNMTAKLCTKALNSRLCLLGIPILIKSDGGPAFDCKLFNNFCKDLGVVHILTSAYNLESNGQYKRMVQEVKKMMLKTGERDPQLIMRVLNNTERRGGGLGTPIKILFNTNVKGFLPNSNNEEMDIQKNLQRIIKKQKK